MNNQSSENKHSSLASMFAKTFLRFGFDIKEGCDRISFESKILRGDITLKKPVIITWKEKSGYTIVDMPITNGKSSTRFKKLGDMLNFRFRRILHEN